MKLNISTVCISGFSDRTSFGYFSGKVSENFSNPSDELGRVKVAKYNLKIKTSYVYLVLITLCFSGIGATGFREIIEKR